MYILYCEAVNIVNSLSCCVITYNLIESIIMNNTVSYVAYSLYKYLRIPVPSLWQNVSAQ